MVSNKSNSVWNLRPIIAGDYWCGADAFVVPAQTTLAYELTYCPLSMTIDDEKHVVCMQSIHTSLVIIYTKKTIYF